MAGRGRMLRQGADGRRGLPAAPGGPFIRGLVPSVPPVPRPLQPSALEEELEFQNMEVQRLLADNHRLADDNLAFQRHIADLNQELYEVNLMNECIRGDKDAQVGELTERIRQLEAGLRACEPLKNEALRLQVQLATLQVDNQQIPVLRQDIQGLQQELIRARSALENEKKRNADLLGQRLTLEQSIFALAHEMNMLDASRGSSGRRLFSDNGIQPSNPEGPLPSSSGSALGPHSGTAGNAPVHGTGSGPWGGFPNSHPPRR